MPADIERQLAALGKIWNETIVHVDASELSHAAARGSSSFVGIEDLASAPSPVQPPGIDSPNTDQDAEVAVLTELNPTTSRRWLPFLVAAAVVALVVAGIALLTSDDSPSRPVDTPPTTQELFGLSDAMSIAREYVERYNAGDVAGVLALFAPSATFTDRWYGGGNPAGTLEEFALALEWKTAGGTQLIDDTCSGPGPNASAPLPTQPGSTSVAETDEVTIVCEYGEHDAVTQAASREPVPITLTFVVGADGIHEWNRVIGIPDFVSCCEDFRRWVAALPRDVGTWDYGVSATADEARAAGELYAHLAEEWVAFTTPGLTSYSPRVCKSVCSATQPDDSAEPSSPATSQPG